MQQANLCGYEIVRKLAQGGMGVVYLGHEKESGELVAIKTLRGDLYDMNDDWRIRFLREGKALRELNHPNIVKMLALCEDDDQLFIVMEYLEGGSLAAKIAEADAHLPLAQVLDIALQLADALTRAHYLKIIHRDLKPANVLMSADGRACLTDFGVARTGLSELTAGGAIVGTMGYLCPEVVQGQEATERSDIWSFGVLLFEMLAGCHPFLAESPSATLLKILSEPPPDLEVLRTDIPIQLVDLVYRMLDKDPAQRISSVRQVGVSLENIASADSAEMVILPSSMDRFKMPAAADTPRARHKLPKELTPFLGRAREMTLLSRLLTEDEERLVTLIGPGGIGKTRLAIESARAISDHFKDGVAFVPLAALDSVDSLIPAIWEAVDYPPGHADSRTPEEQTADFFAPKEMLLIFDNCEHLLEGTELIYGLLRSASGVRVLATTTERLNLQGETIYRLEGIDYPSERTGDSALDYAAVQLFIEASRRWRPGFEVTDENLLHIVRICQLVQGLPLGILLASAWVDALSVEEIANEIAADLDFLSAEMRDMPDRQRSIRATFDGAWRRLSAAEQETFARLTIFRGGFDLEAAKAISGASVRNLLSLTSKSLLWRDATSGRYNMHRLLRQYAQTELMRRGKFDAIQRKHAEYFADLAERLDQQLREANELPWYDRLRDENDNFLAALDWALIQEHDPVVGGRLFAGLGFQWFLADNVVDGTNWMERSLKFADSMPVDVQARVYNRSGLIGCVQGNYAQAAAHHAHSVKLFRRVGDEGHLSYALMAQANMSYAAGMGKLANPLVEESLNAAYRAEDPFFLAAALSTAARFARRAGNEERAHQLLREGIRLADSYPNYLMRYGALRSHARMASDGGDFQLALAKFQEALVIARELKRRPEELDTLEEMAYTYYLVGDLQKAETHFLESLRQGEEINQFNLIAWNLIGLGMVYLQQGRSEASKAKFEERLSCQPAEESNWQIALCLAGMGKIAWQSGQVEIAAKLLGASESVIESGDFLPFPRFTEEWQTILDDLRPVMDNGNWQQGRAMSAPQAIDYALRQGGSF